MTQIRETIEKLCVVLKYNGICEVTAETFRLAKFDNTEAAKPMWTTLKNMLIWLESAPTSRNFHTKTFSSGDYPAVVRFCKHEMFTKGYRVRPFFVLPENKSSGSREILLAIGWLMAKENILEKFTGQVRSFISEDFPSIASNCSGIAPQMFLEPAKVGTKDSEELLDIVIQEVILMRGKLNSACRSLLASRREYGKMLKKIHAATLPFPPKPPPSSSSHLSAMDVYLLYNTKELNNYQQNLEIENLYLHSLFVLKEREALFWKWLESAIDARVNHRDKDHGSDSSESEECLVLNQEGYRPSKHTQGIKAKQVELSQHLQEKEQLYQNVSLRWKRYRQVIEQSDAVLEQFQTLLACLDQEVLEELERVYNDMESQILLNNEGLYRIDSKLISHGLLQLLAPAVIPQSKKYHRVSDTSNEQSALFSHIQELQEKDKVLKEELMQLKKQHNDRITKLTLTMSDMVCIPPSTK